MDGIISSIGDGTFVVICKELTYTIQADALPKGATVGNLVSFGTSGGFVQNVKVIDKEEADIHEEEQEAYFL
jgi:hypothetical protein